ncbi:hypothetical protein [Clostridium sp. Marseille-QA1073]
MKEYIFNILFIFVIVFGAKDLIIELRKIKEHRVIITKGRVKVNNDLLHGIVTTTWAIIFSVLFFITEVDVDMVVLKSNIMIICMGIPKLLTGIRNEIRDDGVYIRKEIYKWNKVESYQWCNENKRGNGNIIFYVHKYDDNFYDKKVKLKVNKDDKEKLQGFLNEIGLKASNMI